MPLGWFARDSEIADPFTFAAVWRAYLACRRGKRHSSSAQRYEMNGLERIMDTANALQSRCYTPARALSFIAKTPKAREIHAADFSDRVVHHLLVPYLERLYEPVLIHDVYSNRKGKGIHAAVARLQTFQRRVSHNGQRPAYQLQLDIANFFNRIDRRRLFGLIDRRLSRAVFRDRVLAPNAADDLRWLTRRLLTGNPALSAYCMATPAELAQVPPHKRLINAPPEKGLPIGNLTSQFFANVYLNELDQFIKHQLKCRFYLRYVDDFMLLHESAEQLVAWRDAIQAFLVERLTLTLKDPHVTPQPISQGANFLGYIVRPHYRLVRRRVVANLHQRLRLFAAQAIQAGCLQLFPASREQLRATLASYLGHFRHAHSYRLRQALWRRYPWLGLLFRCAPDGCLKPLWEPPRVSSLRSQWRYFKQTYPSAWVLLQVGNRIECYDDDVNRCLQYYPYWRYLRGASLKTRPGFQQSASWPLCWRHGLLKQLSADRCPFIYVAEEGYLRGGLKRRTLRIVAGALVPTLERSSLYTSPVIPAGKRVSSAREGKANTSL